MNKKIYVIAYGSLSFFVYIAAFVFGVYRLSLPFNFFV